MKVLVVKTSSMGDVIHTFPSIEDARRNRPDVSFDWCVEEAFAGIVALHPAIGAIHTVAIRRWRKAPFSPDTWREAATLRRALREARYDLVIDAQGLLKSALVARQAAAPIAGLDRASAREPSATLFYDRKYAVPRGLHAIERTRRLFGLALGYEPDLSTLDSGIVPPPGGLRGVGGPTAFLLHGTSREDKKWPVADWIETARLLAAKGMTPVTTWSNAAEKAVAEAIAADRRAEVYACRDRRHHRAFGARGRRRHRPHPSGQRFRPADGGRVPVDGTGTHRPTRSLCVDVAGRAGRAAEPGDGDCGSTEVAGA
jgi:heptosyltransferase-1